MRGLIHHSRSEYSLSLNNYKEFIDLIHQYYPKDVVFVHGITRIKNSKEVLTEYIEDKLIYHTGKPIVGVICPSPIFYGRELMILEIICPSIFIFKIVLPTFKQIEVGIDERSGLREYVYAIEVFMHARIVQGWEDISIQIPFKGPTLEEGDIFKVLSMVNATDSDGDVIQIENAYYIPSLKKMIIGFRYHFAEVTCDKVIDFTAFGFDIVKGFYSVPGSSEVPREFIEDFSEWVSRDRKGDILKYRTI